MYDVIVTTQNLKSRTSLPKSYVTDCTLLINTACILDNSFFNNCLTWVKVQFLQQEGDGLVFFMVRVVLSFCEVKRDFVSQHTWHSTVERWSHDFQNLYRPFLRQFFLSRPWREWQLQVSLLRSFWKPKALSYDCLQGHEHRWERPKKAVNGLSSVRRKIWKKSLEKWKPEMMKGGRS